MSETISINLMPTHAEITTINGTVKQTKHISLDMFRSMMSMDSVTTPLFPLHVVKYVSENNKIYIMTCEKVNILDYFINTGPVDNEGNSLQFDTYRYHIPYIYFIWKLDKIGANGYKVRHENIFCSFQEPTEDTVLYVPKIGNVYDDAHICWGSNRDVHSEFNNLIHLRQAQKTFLIAVHTNEMTMNSEISRNNNKIFKTEAEFVSSGLTKGTPASLITRFNKFIQDNR